MAPYPLEMRTDIKSFLIFDRHAVTPRTEKRDEGVDIMDVSNLLFDGVNLMLLGMGSVFVFLTVLVLTMSGVSRLIIAISGDDLYSDPQAHPLPAEPEKEHDEIIAVISAAISRYRNKS